jgi:hypothetical protein
VVSPPADNPTSDSPAECLVLVSDTSTEAERLIASLRVRGVKVRDVPLMLLPGRVEAQRPQLVICDGQVARVAESVAKMRQGVWGATVELLLLGIDLRVIEAIRPIVTDIDSRTFARPIDVYTVLQRIEEVTGHQGVASRPGSRSMAALPRVTTPSASAAGRAPTPAPRRGRSSVPNLAPRLNGIAAARGEVLESSPKLPSIAPPSEASAPDSAMQGVPVARMSEELEQLLNDADRRLATGPMSLQPISLSGARMSPEQELDAILPPDVLAALDEPVDLDDEDETSHPAARNRDRPSSMAPRGTPVSALEQPYLGQNDAMDRFVGGTSPVDDDTPIGRPAGRGRFATASGGSDAPSGLMQGSVLTPVPASVKTHHTHHTQANSSPQSSATGEFIDNAPEHELSSSAYHDAEGRRRVESDSVVPGTNPELEGVAPRSSAGEGSVADREVSSTAPPHPARSAAVNPEQLWESLDDAASLRREYGVSDEPPPTVAMRGAESHSTSTSPPAKVRSSARSATRAEGRSNVQVRSSSFEPEASAADSYASSTADGRPNIEVPAALGPGDVVRALSRCVRSRYSGALAIEDESGIRRVVMREGDFVMVASGIDGESLVAFLIQRGDLDADAGRLARKLPQFGRHAGAALIAHGYLRQDELWPVLRAHAEWLLGRALGVSPGSAGLEIELPARLQAEPGVFGGATGAEILVEIVRRIVTPEIATEMLGGPRVRLTRGAASRLLSECALSSVEAQLVERAAGLTLEQLLTQAQSPDFVAALYALVELGVLDTMAPSSEAVRDPRQPPERDGLDDAAVRSRIAIRRALVDEGDYFALLGISHEATGYEVRHAYLDLRREFEPSRLLTAATADLREDVDLVLEVLDEAYEILRDSARRDRYRRALEAPPATTS